MFIACQRAPCRVAGAGQLPYLCYAWVLSAVCVHAVSPTVYSHVWQLFYSTWLVSQGGHSQLGLCSGCVLQQQLAALGMCLVINVTPCRVAGLGQATATISVSAAMSACRCVSLLTCSASTCYVQCFSHWLFASLIAWWC
jgi:hypothetical protein